MPKHRRPNTVVPKHGSGSTNIGNYAGGPRHQRLNRGVLPPIGISMNRRFFERTTVRANGELFWATKGRFGKLTNHHAYFHSENLSLDGARLIMSPDIDIPDGSVVRVKFGLETCAAEVRTTERFDDTVVLRVIFLNPSVKFVSTIEQWIPVDETKRSFANFWTGADGEPYP